MAEVRAGCQTIRVEEQGQLGDRRASATALLGDSASRHRLSACPEIAPATRRMRACTSSSGLKITSPAGPRANPTGNPCRSSPRSADVACTCLHALFELVQLSEASHAGQA